MSITKQKPMGRASSLLLAGIFLVLGITFVFVWFASMEPLPSDANLTEVRGALQSYSCRGKSLTAVCDLTLQDGSYVSTDALYSWAADEMFRGKPVEIRAWAKDGKSYGLWINGREIRTNRYALSREWILMRFIIPLIGLGVLGLLYLSIRASAET
jgi:hypothetical protein